MAEYDSVAFIVSMGAIAAADSVYLEGGNESDGSDAAAISVSIAYADTDDNDVLVLEAKNPQHRCIRCVVGSSDRLYLNHWITSVASDLKEGVHYQVMFYGGRLLSQLLGNYFASDHERLRELAARRGLHRLHNMAACPTT